MINVFRLKPDSENYQTLVLRDGDDWRRVRSFTEEFAPPELWRPVEVVVFRDFSPGKFDLPPGDFPSLSPVDVFSANAVRALGNVLHANGRLLPMRSREGEYFLFVPTTILDALDASRSRMWTLDTGRVVRIDEYCFQPGAVKDAMIFRLKQRPWVETYVADAFVEKVRSAGLKGFAFKKVWSGDSQ